MSPLEQAEAPLAQQWMKRSRGQSSVCTAPLGYSIGKNLGAINQTSNAALLDSKDVLLKRLHCCTMKDGDDI